MGIKCLLWPYFIGTWGGGRRRGAATNCQMINYAWHWTLGGIFRDSSAPSPPRMWEWSSPICSDEMPNFWKVNILQTNTINIWPTGSLLASGREMGAIRGEKERRGRQIITTRWKQSWGEKQTLTRGDNDDNFLWGKRRTELWRGCKHPSWHGGRWEQWYSATAQLDQEVKRVINTPISSI